MINGYKQVYLEFWKELVENSDDSLNKDAVMKELSDYSILLDNVPKVYAHVTMGRISKPNTDAFAVIAEADDITNDLVDEAVQEYTNDQTSTKCKGCGKTIDTSYCQHCNHLWES